MNRLIFNWKYHVKKIIDGRTLEGILDVGFREFKYRRFQLSGMVFPDPKRINNAEERAKAEELWTLSKPALELLLTYKEKPTAPQWHGRTIILATHAPSIKTGQCLANAYVPVRQESFDHPHLFRRAMGYVFMNVTHFMQHLGERRFDLKEGRDLLEICEPYDFDK